MQTNITEENSKKIDEDDENKKNTQPNIQSTNGTDVRPFDALDMVLRH